MFDAARTALLAACLVIACGGHPVATDDGDSPSAEAGEADGSSSGTGMTDFPIDCESADLQNNPYHCGECFHSCLGLLNVGECVDGECGARFSDCTEVGSGATSCDDVCAGEGAVCAPERCGGATVATWPQGGETSCLLGNTQDMTALTGACSEPIQWGDGVAVAACCCAPA